MTYGRSLFSTNKEFWCKCGSFNTDVPELDDYRSSNLLFGGAGYVPSVNFDKTDNVAQSIKSSFVKNLWDLTSIEFFKV